MFVFLFLSGLGDASAAQAHFRLQRVRESRNFVGRGELALLCIYFKRQRKWCHARLHRAPLKCNYGNGLSVWTLCGFLPRGTSQLCVGDGNGSSQRRWIRGHRRRRAKSDSVCSGWRQVWVERGRTLLYRKCGFSEVRFSHVSEGSQRKSLRIELQTLQFCLRSLRFFWAPGPIYPRFKKKKVSVYTSLNVLDNSDISRGFSG